MAAKKNLTQIPNCILNSKELTFQSKGLYFYILSKPKGWDFTAKNISSQTKESVDSINRAIHQLEMSHLLKRNKLYGGKVEYELQPLDNQSCIAKCQSAIQTISQSDNQLKCQSAIQPKHSNTIKESNTIEKSNTKKDTDVSKKEKFLDKVFLSQEEYINLCKLWGKANKRYTENERDLAIEELDNYLRSSGKKYESHYAVLQGWVYEKIKANPPPPRPIDPVPGKVSEKVSQVEWDEFSDQDKREAIALADNNWNA